MVGLLMVDWEGFLCKNLWAEEGSFAVDAWRN
jgi:hypothetical protein